MAMGGGKGWRDIALLKLNNSKAAKRNPDVRRIGTKCLHVVSSATLEDRRPFRCTSASPPLHLRSSDSSFRRVLSSLVGSANGKAKEILARSIPGARRERERRCYCYRDAIKLAGNGNYDLNG